MRIFFFGILAFSAFAQTVVLQTGTVLDGRGGVVRGAQIVVENGRITKIGPGTAKADYDLRGLTLMPGWIDTHVHLDWHFDAVTGKLATRTGEKPQELALYAAENAWLTLQAGFTTVQSVGSMTDGPLRDRILKGYLPGPRILTSLRQITNQSGDPETIRALVRQTKADGADVIKVFATLGLGAGGEQSMTDAQLEAACGEAKAQGLRSVVHAISAKGAAASVRAGCTSVEHGDYVDDAALTLMRERGVYFDPNFLVLHNYLDLKEKFNFPEASLANLEKAIEPSAHVLQRARALGVKVVFGTDAVAGAHGRNAEEFVYRVRDAGEKPGDALLSATSVAAESLGLGARIGTVAVGYEADFVATEGNPLEDVTAVRRVKFVMRGGRVFRNGR